MRRLAFLFVLVVTAVLIPGKRVKAQTVAAAQTVVVRSVEKAGQTVKVVKSVHRGRSHSTGRNVGMAVGWLLLVSIVGFALLAFGSDKLQIVINTMQGGIGKSLGTGILGHLAIVPGAVAVVVLLAVTLIGILLIPLGLLAFIFAVAGIAMVGFVAVAIMTGAAVYLGMWIGVALLSGVPLVGAMVEAFVSAVTFIAVTTGFGAVLLSYWRGDFKKAEVTA
jgi:hypothetical protein